MCSVFLLKTYSTTYYVLRQQRQSVAIHNVGDKPTVILYTTFIAIVVSHIQRIGRQPEKTTLHSSSGQSRSSWSAEQGNVYSIVHAIPVA